MPKPGDQVIYYTHDASDSVHSANDSLAWVIRVVDDHTVDVLYVPDVVATAVPRPVQLMAVRVSEWAEWDDTKGPRPIGLSYWRAAGSEPPDMTPNLAPAREAEDKQLAEARAAADRLKGPPVPALVTARAAEDKAIADRRAAEDAAMKPKAEVKRPDARRPDPPGLKPLFS
jgi:hypothetical protein